MSELQTKPCKKCHYQEFEHGSTIATWRNTNWISKEPLKPIECPNCHILTQIHSQSGHRRFWKCWKCGYYETDNKFYDIGELYP